MNYNNNCDSCGTELKEIFSHSFDLAPYFQERNFYQNFLIKKRKGEEFKTEFQFCGNCQKEFGDWLTEEAIQELKQNNIANSEILTYRFFSSDFTEENWQKYQTALTENIKRHSGEWKIKQVNYQPYQWEKPREDGRTPRSFAQKIEMRTILYHQSFKLEFDKNGSLTLENSWDPRKIYFQHYFLPEKWTEIEIKLSQNEETEGRLKTTSQPQSNFLTICLITFLIIGMVILLTYLAKKKKKQLKL